MAANENQRNTISFACRANADGLVVLDNDHRITM